MLWHTRRARVTYCSDMISTTEAGGNSATDLYGGKDPRDLARYSYSEAARATGVPASTIASWVRPKSTRRVGGDFFRPVIERPGEGRLSFYNLIEVHVLRSLRTKHSVQLEHVRRNSCTGSGGVHPAHFRVADGRRLGSRQSQDGARRDCGDECSRRLHLLLLDRIKRRCAEISAERCRRR